MTKLDISISSIRYSIETNEEELESLKAIAKSLNSKTNELMMKTGRISDRLLLFILLLVNTNKKEKIFKGDFEENMIKLLKKSIPFMSNGDNLDSQLILSNIITESLTSDIVEDKTTQEVNEDTLKLFEENKKTNEDTIKFFDDLIKFIEKLANNINKM